MQALIYKPETLQAHIKDMDMRKGIVTGYFASFNTLDSDGDIILPGAFTKSIKESGPDSGKPRIKHLLNHDYEQPLGEIKVLTEDAKGLYYESQIGTHDLGIDFLKMVDSNLITEHSIGFRIVKKEHDETKDIRNLIELKLWEGSSLTAWGANEDTPLTGIKSLTFTSAYDRMGKLIAAISKGTFTDHTIKILEYELLNIQEAFKSYGTTKPEPLQATTKPNDEDELLIELQTINNKFKLFDYGTRSTEPTVYTRN